MAKAKETAAPLIEKVEQYAEIAKEKTSETVNEVVETVKEKAVPIVAKAKELAEEAKEKISETVATTKEKVTAFVNEGSTAAPVPVEKTANRIEEDAD